MLFAYDNFLLAYGSLQDSLWPLQQQLLRGLKCGCGSITAIRLAFVPEACVFAQPLDGLTSAACVFGKWPT